MDPERAALPLSAGHALARMHLDGAGPSTPPDDALAEVGIQRTVLQDFVPLDRSPEQGISQLAGRRQPWPHAHSIAPTCRDQRSNLSQAAARLFYTHRLGTNPAGSTRRLRAWPGTGLQMQHRS